MTKAPADTERPLRRTVVANGETLIVEITERRCVLRYPRARKPLCAATWGIIVLRLLGER